MLEESERDPTRTDARAELKRILSYGRLQHCPETTRARELLRRYADLFETWVAQPDEPGPPLVVHGVVRNALGDAIADALVYAFHTDARGYNSPGGMDEANPRPFAYVRACSRRPGRYATL